MDTFTTVTPACIAQNTDAYGLARWVVADVASIWEDNVRHGHVQPAVGQRVVDFLETVFNRLHQHQDEMEMRRYELHLAAGQCAVEGHWYEWIDPSNDTLGEMCINCGDVRPFAW